MKALFLVFFLFPLTASAGELLPDRMPPYVVRYEEDKDVKSDSGKVIVECGLFGTNVSGSDMLFYGINGSTGMKYVRTNQDVVFDLAPGNYAFLFYVDCCLEIETDSIEVRPGMNTVIALYFEPFTPVPVQPIEIHTIEPIMDVKKPVIYLYPETELNIAVHVLPTGKMTFSYPDYGTGWSVAAQPNGDLSVNGKKLPYLFWESEQPAITPFANKEGFVVKSENVTAFLEEKLTLLGLNEREQTDFITFWGPQLAVNSKSAVRFMINEACDAFATLDISPRPEHVNRVYLVWCSAESELVTDALKEQELTPLDRSGFDVLEWGGTEFTFLQGVEAPLSVIR